jgi:predicted amidohydrolase YtcJ
MGRANELSRRGLLGAAGVAAAAAAGLSTGVAQAAPRPPTSGAQGDLALVNGKIHTFDENDSVVSQVLIRDGRFAAVGSVGGGAPRVINLRGRTVIPGIIGNHEHFIRIGQAVGYDMRRLETAFSIEAVQQTIADYAETVPDGEFLTGLRGIHRRQWSDEERHPTRAELDAAAPRHPVVISHGSNGQTNTLGRDRLRNLGAIVSDEGSVNDDQAYIALSQFLTPETKKRELLRAAEYCLSVGLTMAQDQHGSAGAPGTAGHLDRVTGHDHYVQLVREKALNVRTRCFFPEQNDTGELQQIVNYLWREFGSDMHQATGIGEWAPRGESYQMSLRIIAERNLIYHQHLISTSEIQDHLDALNAFVASNPDLPTPAELRWRLAHLHSSITESQVLEANQLGVGLLPHGGSRYLSGNDGGPKFRMIVDLATVPVGTSMDGARVAPINPWPGIFYMVTGRNSAGVLTNDGAQLTREEAIRLYAGPQQGWFTREEHRLGGIGVGRYADLVVLAGDVFDPVAVPDEALRTMTSVLTIVDGRIVHDAGVLNT